jgi:hypothetical protein
VVGDKSFLNGMEEEIVESCIDDENDDLGGSVPVLVDFHETVSSEKNEKLEELPLTEEWEGVRDALGSI